mmetsp:Transcript_20703/g.36811  ORF Transcript_20703/g.36811 Transcript_20703/m.36811 type:complete len:359 (-) Transcript_20703:169-1245(-)
MQTSSSSLSSLVGTALKAGFLTLLVLLGLAHRSHRLHEEASEPYPSNAETPQADIIAGSGSFRYKYMPDLLHLPEGAQAKNCHGFAMDSKNNIYLTYENMGDDKNCLVRWRPDGTSGEFLTGGGSQLCDGVPHGLKIAREAGKEYFYHANNERKLTKTELDGRIVWQVKGNFGQKQDLPYRPTWFGIPPKGDYIYLADGYGSNHVYVFTRNGRFTGHTYGGPGSSHGLFHTDHGITYDPRVNQLAVSDRENHRLEYYDFDPSSPGRFSYNWTTSIPGVQRPCNIRPLKDMAIVPALEGPVAILDLHNKLVTSVNVSGLLGDQGHRHPHDAMLLPNGDFVVATWNPGRLSYWKKLDVRS